MDDRLSAELQSPCGCVMDLAWWGQHNIWGTYEVPFDGFLKDKAKYEGGLGEWG